MIYNWIGRAVVKFGLVFLRRKAVANKALLGGVGGVAVVAVLAATAGFLLTRETPEA